MDEDELIELQDIFYSEAPYNYDLAVSNERPDGNILASCHYDTRMCIIYAPEDYDDALISALHEIAHARIQHTTHSDVWEQEFVRLLRKYRVNRKILADHTTYIGPNVREYING